LVFRSLLQRSNTGMMVWTELPKADRERLILFAATLHFFGRRGDLSTSAAADSGSRHFLLPLWFPPYTTYRALGALVTHHPL
jgi:hypothetical protein